MLSTQVSATASDAADSEIREPYFSVTISDVELLPADRKRCATNLLLHTEDKCFSSHVPSFSWSQHDETARLRESSAGFSPRSSGTDACANALGPLPSPDLLAERSHPRMLRECGLQVRKYWGSKAIQKNDETSRLFKTTTSKRTSFADRYEHPKF